jgi:hypothetical protein
MGRALTLWIAKNSSDSSRLRLPTYARTGREPDCPHRSKQPETPERVLIRLNVSKVLAIGRINGALERVVAGVEGQPLLCSLG